MQKKNKYRWLRDDGEWVSPIFTTLQAAQTMPESLPFLTDEEWAMKPIKTDPIEPK
jgi:hypothetical protein